MYPVYNVVLKKKPGGGSGISWEFEASCSTEQVPGQPGLYPQTTLSGVGGRTTPKKQPKPLYFAECGAACLYSQPSGGRDNLVYIMSSRPCQEYIVFQKRVNRWDVVICQL